MTKDAGETWDVLGDLPFVFVHDLVFHPRDRMIVIATHGRGMWVFDAEQLTFDATFDMGGERMVIEIDGRLEGDTVSGTGSSSMGESEFTATKEGSETAATEVPTEEG